MSIKTSGFLSGYFILLSIGVCAQNYQTYQNNLQELNGYARLSDTALRRSQTDAWWKKISDAHEIPMIGGDSVAFLYKGKASAIDWMGDFNGWGSVKTFDNRGKRVPGTDIWILKAGFPRNTRLDYKIVVNGAAWILDPENSLQQWSGVGGGSPNSELCMPDWKEDPILKTRSDVARGTLKEDILIDSKVLGYQVTYSIYEPHGVTPLSLLPTLYVTDGYEYLHPRLGNMIPILDNLIADKKIKPIIVVFVDNREPVNRGNNKRMDELAMNPKYLEFFTKELIPSIESQFPVKREAYDRAIMGCSMGGLNAAYFAFSKPGVFGMAGIQSPAFWMRPQIYTLCNNSEHPMNVSMTSGVINDASAASLKMKDIMLANSCKYQYHEVNDGHSWGNWRNLIDDVLMDLFAK